LDVKLEPDLLGVAGSPVHLSKTVMNLVSNAAEAMLQGGMVSVMSGNRYIDQPIKGYDDIKEGDYVTLTISDTGIGIAEADIDRIFEPFYTKKAMGRSGTGLGMAVVWGTVKDHQGYIDVQSTEGKGTVFHIYLPACRKSSPHKQSRPSIEDYKGRGESVLVVDDIKEQRAIATGILTKLGYRVDSVSSGEQAVAYIQKKAIDMIVLDMIMDPGIDGLETYQRIVQLRPGQKAIIASGFSESERVKEAQKLGLGAYVKKPYLMEKLALAIRIELDR
jgi:CheY-like chemotaxis protein